MERRNSEGSDPTNTSTPSDFPLTLRKRTKTSICNEPSVGPGSGSTSPHEVSPGESVTIRQMCERLSACLCVWGWGGWRNRDARVMWKVLTCLHQTVGAAGVRLTRHRTRNSSDFFSGHCALKRCGGRNRSSPFIY